MKSFKFIVVRHQKSQTAEAFNQFTRINEIVDMIAMEKTIAELSKLFPRKLLKKKNLVRQVQAKSVRVKMPIYQGNQAQMIRRIFQKLESAKRQ